MQKPKLVDNATPALEFQDSSTQEALNGTILRAIFQNDNFGNLFKLVEGAGYTLVDGDLSQIVKSVKGLYDPAFTYNTSAVSTQTVNDVVLGSDGVYYVVQSDGVTNDDPVGSTTGDWEVDVSRGQQSEVFEKPNGGIVLFTKISPAEFNVPAGFKININGVVIQLESNISLSLNTDLDTGTKSAGTDYYVYMKEDESFYISVDSAKTDGIVIGGFHYGLTPEAEAPTGNKTESDMVKIRGINSYSFWDLKFRPVASPKGMVYINSKWFDIYLLNSEHIVNGTSKANLVIAGGDADANGRLIPKIPLEYGGDGTVNYGKFTWFQACEVGRSHGKDLILYSEFGSIAYGVNEQKSSQADGYEIVVGKIEHYSNLTSVFGIEQATGTQWLWGSNVAGNRDEGLTVFDWRTGLTDNRGDIFSLNDNNITAVRLGGDRGGGVSAGSRCSNWNNPVSGSSWSLGCRFSCAHLNLA